VGRGMPRWRCPSLRFHDKTRARMGAGRLGGQSIGVSLKPLNASRAIKRALSRRLKMAAWS